MIPLIFAEEGQPSIIKKIGGSSEVKKHLEDMGFVPGSMATLITQNNGNIIVNVKGTRVAISKEMAQKIMI